MLLILKEIKGEVSAERLQVKEDLMMVRLNITCFFVCIFFYSCGCFKFTETGYDVDTAPTVFIGGRDGDGFRDVAAVDQIPETGEQKTEGEKFGEPRDEFGEKEAIVTHYAVNVFRKKTLRSALVGVLRKGSTVHVAYTGLKTDQCVTGWYYMTRAEGYVCKGHGIKILEGKEGKRVARPVHEPWFDALLPYHYGHIIGDDIPAYNRFPTKEERGMVSSWLSERRALLEAQVEAVRQAMEEGKPVPNPYEPIEIVVSNEDGSVQKIETGTEWTADVEGGAVPTKIPFRFVERVLLKGFYVTIAMKLYRNGRVWYKTVRGHLIDGSSVRITTPPYTKGCEINYGQDLPVIFVKRRRVDVYSYDAESSRMRRVAEEFLSRFDSAFVESEVEIEGRRFLKIGSDRYIRKKDVLLVEKASPPAVVKSTTKKWIDVNISKQVLVAYEGERPVYAALVSTGRENENVEYKTPRGIFSILSKHVTSTMSNFYATDGPYMIEDVPWTMYFIGSYALHGAFWHNGFGRMRSHGCVNLSPHDARWLFYWAEPELYEGFHSVYSSAEHPGTIVKVHD